VNWSTLFLKTATRAYKQWNRDAARRQKQQEKAWQHAGQERQAQAHLATRISLDREIAQLSDFEFEAFVATLFESEGWETSLTPRGADEGIDIEMRKTLDGETAIVQCKKWSGNVGQPVVRDLYGAMHHRGCDTGYVVTSSGFTPAAIAFAQGKPICLIGGAELLGRIGRSKMRQLPSSSGKGVVPQAGVEPPFSTRSDRGPSAEGSAAASLPVGEYGLTDDSVAYLRLMAEGCANVRQVARSASAQTTSVQPGLHILTREDAVRLVGRHADILGTVVNSVTASWTRGPGGTGQGLAPNHGPVNVQSLFDEITTSLHVAIAGFEEVRSSASTNQHGSNIIQALRDCYIAFFDDVDAGGVFAHTEKVIRLFLESPQAALRTGVARRLPNGDVHFEGSPPMFQRFTEAIARLGRLGSSAPQIGTGCLTLIATFLALVAALGIVAGPLL
jgi:hypothetical protein